jgi:hypothetical protein
MIVVFLPPPFTMKNYIVLYLEKENGLLQVEHWYPNCVRAIWLPKSLNSVVKMIHQRKIAKRSFLHHSILRTVGELAEREGSIALETKFASEREANDYIINVVIDNYIVTALHDLKRSQRKRLKEKVKEAKEHWIMKRNGRQQSELYLGRLTFDQELKRSCGEFYSSLKNVWGCSPTKLDYMK